MPLDNPDLRDELSPSSSNALRAWLLSLAIFALSGMATSVGGALLTGEYDLHKLAGFAFSGAGVATTTYLLKSPRK